MWATGCKAWAALDPAENPGLSSPKHLPRQPTGLEDFQIRSPHLVAAVAAAAPRPPLPVHTFHSSCRAHHYAASGPASTDDRKHINMQVRSVCMQIGAPDSSGVFVVFTNPTPVLFGAFIHLYNPQPAAEPIFSPHVSPHSTQLVDSPGPRQPLHTTPHLRVQRLFQMAGGGEGHTVGKA